MTTDVYVRGTAIAESLAIDPGWVDGLLESPSLTANQQAPTELIPVNGRHRPNPTRRGQWSPRAEQ